MELDHLFASRLLVQPVDILGQHGLELPLRLQLRQGQVAVVWLCLRIEHLFLIKAIEFLRPADKIAVADDLLRGLGILLIVQTVHAAEIRDAGLRGNAGAAEKDDASAFADPLLQGLDRFGHAGHSLAAEGGWPPDLRRFHSL